MKVFPWTSRIIAGIFLVFWLPVASFAFTPGDFVVSPTEIDLGKVWVTPGASAGPYKLSIAVVGGPVADPDPAAKEEATFYASSDSPWLTLDPANGTVPGSITATATISETMMSGLWTANVTIVSGLDSSTQPVTVPVTITVTRSIGDLLTVSPSKLDLMMTPQTAFVQTFPVTIANADPDPTKPADFRWSARSDVSWLSLSADEGVGESVISLRVDPAAIYLNTDTDLDGIPDEAVGVITVRSTLSAEPVTLTVNSTVLTSSTELSVSPAQLFWTFEKASDGTASTAFDSQRLQVFGFESGWTAASDMGFVTAVAYNADGERSGTGEFGQVVSDERYGWVEVTPVASMLASMDYGTHTGYITISSLNREYRRRVPIIINIRRPGEAVNLPIPEITMPDASVVPYYAMMEAADSSLINVQMPVPLDFVYYPTSVSCQGAGGMWVDPDNTPGNLDEYCSLNQHAYVLIERTEVEPGKVYALTKSNKLSLAYENGVKVLGADALSYADGPISYIPFGPLQMTGSYGPVVVSMRIGANLSSAVEIQRLLISLQTPDGQWKVTEAYNGAYYVYDFAPLMIDRVAGQAGYTSSWEDIPVTVSTGDGTTWLYKLSFEQNGIYYSYEIKSLSGNQMSGRWQFAWPGGTSNWEAFEAQRQLWLFP